MLQVFLFFLGLILTTVLGSLPSIPNYPGLTLAYEDDFNNLNGAIFTIVDGFVQTPYAQVCYKANNVGIDNGELVIKTRRENVQCNYRGENKNFGFTSGWIDTQGKFAIRDGLMEVRSKLPPPVNKIWPAAWLISERNLRDTGACWPSESNEIE
jgi:beta-glucanase (GH16 family)